MWLPSQSQVNFEGLIMKEANRDILVLSNQAHLSREELERQVAELTIVLYHAEQWESFCLANEVIDINRYKIIQKPYLIEKILRDKAGRPFVFICNKN